MRKVITEYLGEVASSLLAEEPFSSWPVERVLEKELPEPRVYYIFKTHGLELRCDEEERVNTIFLRTDEYDDFKLIPFSWGRQMVLEYFGSPSKSGNKLSDPVLGDFGAWDRFTLPKYTVHVEYRIESEGIKRITLMCADAVPK